MKSERFTSIFKEQGNIQIWNGLFTVAFYLNITAANAYSLGDIKDKKAATRQPARVCLPGKLCNLGQGFSLPSVLDLRSFVTPVKDQKNCGSCVIFAATAALESALLRQNKGLSDLSEQYGLSCLMPSTLCKDGTSLGDYTQSLKKTGTSSELNQYPYIASYGSCNIASKFLTKNNFSYKAATFQKVSIKSATDIKSVLYQYGPVIASFEVYTSLFDHKDASLYRPKKGEKFEGGHAILIVGYSDKIGGFQVKNSWGTTWGDKGFFWIAYDEVVGMSKLGTRGDGVYVITDTATPIPPAPTPSLFTNPIHTYPAGWNFGNPTAWGTITGDFNGDGKTDYVRLGSKYSHVFLSNGNGSFQNPIQNYPAGWNFGTPSTWTPITGDFNDDGKTDYARLGGKYAHIFISNGDGTFQNPIQNYPTGWDFGNPSTWTPITGDFNGDGRTDYARLGSKYSHVFLSNGDGSFQNLIQNYPVGWNFGNPSPWTALTGDFNGDGKTDYMRLGSTYSHLFISNGDGTFQNPIQYYPAGWNFGTPSTWTPITGDFNGDGKTDYARLGSKYSHVFLSNGDGSFQNSIQNYPAGWNFGNPSPWTALTGDFNGDKRTDYIRLGSTYSHLFISNGDGKFQNPIQYYPAGWNFGTPSTWTPITGDFNGDGKTDYARLGSIYSHMFITK